LYFNNYRSQLLQGLGKGANLIWRPKKGASVLDWVGGAIDRKVRQA